MSEEVNDDSDWFSDAEDWFSDPKQGRLSVIRSSHLMCASTDDNDDGDENDMERGDELTAEEKALVLEELKKMEAKELLLDSDWKLRGRAKRTANPVAAESTPEREHLNHTLF